MKYFLTTGLLLASTLSLAGDEIRIERRANPVKVNAVSAELVGEGHPTTEVKVRATFGNECEVPNTEELVSITRFSKNFKNLIISLGSESNRVCPAVYRPVTVTIILGRYTKPNDGSFTKVVVNGKTAK